MHRRIFTSLVLALTAVMFLVGTQTASPEPLPLDVPSHTTVTPPNASTNRPDLNVALRTELENRYALAVWYTAVAEANKPKPVQTSRHRNRQTHSSEAQYGSGACGGDLPSCSIMNCESGGSLNVYNKSGSGASGKWQIMPGTWNGYGGYANAADAPESVQDARAREIWNGGSGRRAWSC